MGLGKKGLCHISRVTILGSAEGNASPGHTRSFLVGHGTAAQRSACSSEGHAQLEASPEARSGANPSARRGAPGWAGLPSRTPSFSHEGLPNTPLGPVSLELVRVKGWSALALVTLNHVFHSHVSVF